MNVPVAIAWSASVAEELEHACVEIERDTRFVAGCPAHMIAANRELIEEARERLNDALAKVGG